MASMEMTGRTANQPMRDTPSLNAASDALNSLSRWLQQLMCRLDIRILN